MLEVGRQLIERGNPTEAIAHFHGLSQRYPAHAAVRFGLGVALMAAGDAAAAAPALLKATRLDPSLLEPRLMLAKALMATSRLAAARDVLTQTAVDFGKAPEVWGLKGSVERLLNDDRAAERSFTTQDQLSPNDANVLNNLAVSIRAQGRFSEAIALYRRALVLQPGFATVHANLGNALDAIGQPQTAETHLRMATEADPQSTDHRFNLAAHLVREEKSPEALPMLRGVVDARPERWDAWTNLGVALVASGEFAEAERCYRKALTLRPQTPEPHYNLAWLLLLLGRWDEGWAEYEWRWQLPSFSSRRWSVATPAWDGTPQPGQTILLLCEQGIGDALQTLRFAAQVRAQCARVIVLGPAPLAGLVSGFNGVDMVVAFDDPIPAHDVHAHIMSLPLRLNITPHNIPNPSGYITPPALPKNLPRTKRPRIGIVWAGSPDNKIDRRRSCDASLFNSLFEGLDVDVVSLQVGPRAADIAAFNHPIAFDLNNNTATWEDTAAVIGAMDLVIGVDTAVLHLAGAMGRPAWLLLPFSPDFRWLLNRADTPWYDSVRLFRQPQPGAWPEVFRDVRGALTNWLQTRP
jgi:Flp pilus assembly protein TadD